MLFLLFCERARRIPEESDATEPGGALILAKRSFYDIDVLKGKLLLFILGSLNM